MKSAAIESVTTTGRESVRLSGDDRAASPRTRWARLYAILLIAVGLCAAGSQIVPRVGHPALLQYGAALAILGFLVAWVRSNRTSLSADESGTHAPSAQPFSVVHVPFSPETIGSGHRVFTEPPGPVHWAAVVQPAESASPR